MTRETLVYRKLRALGISSPQDIHACFQALVLKLEEEKIRHYAVSQRDALKEPDPSKWIESLRKYCNDIGIELKKELWASGVLTPESQIKVLDKLLTVALQEEYTDLVEDGKLNIATEPSVVENSPACLQGVSEKANELLGKLGIPFLSTEDATVEEIRSAIRLLLTLRSDAKKEPAEAPCLPDSLYMNLDDVPCGIRSEDPLVIKAARILRTLHSNELCKLQAEIVWLSERFQQLTANPQTNSHAK